MGIRKRPLDRYYVQPFGLERQAWPLTAKEAARLLGCVAATCIVVSLVAAKMLAFLRPDSAAAVFVPFFTFVLLLIPALHVVHRILRPTDAEIARRWEFMMAHPDDYPDVSHPSP
ncbi:hypothetical protein ACIPVK_04435 [Paeniglutamicibacter sp. MACA_103]|uniref:hypothetical protein n=1 Tax=Paeniglutamicibacter sp. MACA_103 TaxID=3377337 RepID=UPI0038945CAF